MDVTVKQESELVEELRQVDDALAAARSGQSYSIGGRTLTRQDMGELRAERTRLIRDLRTLRAALAGADSPGVEIATWYR